MAHYLDTSAFLKLVLTEPETPALVAWATTADRRFFSSDILRTEALRTARRHSSEALVLARQRLAVVTFIPVTVDICERAAEVDPAILRSLDVLHLATALTLADDLEGVVTYDERLAAAAGLHGVRVVAPA